MSEEPTSTDVQEQQAPEASRRPRWGIITLIGVMLAVIGAALVYLFYQPMYEASAWIQIEDTRPYIAFPDSDTSKVFAETQVELIGSPLVLAPVLSQAEIARIPDLQKQKDPFGWLQKRLEVKQVGKSELFNISYTGRNPEDSAGLVNAVVDEYFNLRGRTEAQRTQRVIELLEEQRERRGEEVNRLRENVRTLTKQATGRDPFAAKPPRDLAPGEVLEELRLRLVVAQVDRELLEARVKAHQKWTSEGQIQIPDGMIEEAVEENADVQARKAELSSKRARLRAHKMKLSLGDEDPIYQQLHEEIERDERMLNELRETLREAVKAELQESFATKQEQELRNVRAQLKSARLIEILLQERCEEQRRNLEQGGVETIELEFARDELARAKEVFDRIAQRIVILRTEQRAPARVTRLQDATVPTAPVASPYRSMATVSLGGFCLPFVLMALWIGVARLRAWKKTP